MYVELGCGKTGERLRVVKEGKEDISDLFKSKHPGLIQMSRVIVDWESIGLVFVERSIPLSNVTLANHGLSSFLLSLCPELFVGLFKCLNLFLKTTNLILYHFVSGLPLSYLLINSTVNWMKMAEDIPP